MPIDIVASMRVFTAVVEADSFAGAADRLDLSRGMATRYVAQLEKHLGVRLLNRTTRTLSLTAAGTDYYQRATQILAMVEEAESAAAQESAAPSGTLRITASEALSGRYLYRAVADYLRRHPGVRVELSTNERFVDLVEEGFDVAVRVAKEIAPGFVARRLAPVQVILCASPSYLKRHGVPRVPEDLARHNCFAYTYASFGNEWRFRGKGGERTVRVMGNLQSNSGEVLHNAVVDGLGLTFEPDFLAHEALKSKRLVRILPDWKFFEELSLFAVYPSRKLLPPKVRSFVDFLVEWFGSGLPWSTSRRQLARAHTGRPL